MSNFEKVCYQYYKKHWKENHKKDRRNYAGIREFLDVEYAEADSMREILPADLYSHWEVLMGEAV